MEDGFLNTRNGCSMKRTFRSFIEIGIFVGFLSSLMVATASAQVSIQEMAYSMRIDNTIIATSLLDDPCQNPVYTDKDTYFRLRNNSSVRITVDTCSCVQPPCQCSFRLYGITYDGQGNEIQTLFWYTGLYSCPNGYTYCFALTAGTWLLGNVDTCTPNKPQIKIECPC